MLLSEKQSFKFTGLRAGATFQINLFMFPLEEQTFCIFDVESFQH